ncbi:MAG: CBS domain-containing protein [Flexilinea sp.]
MQAETFLDLYKNLEQLVKDKYSGNGKRYESPIINFSNSREGRPYKEELDSIREIRNLLVHLPMINGNYPLEPSEEIVAKLQEIIEKIEHPLLALDFAVRSDNIMKARLEDSVFSVMSRMENNGYTHVPIISDGKLFGVFSKSTIFSYLITHGLTKIRDDMQINAFIDFLPIEKHRGEYYDFAAKDALYVEVREMFENTYQRKSRRLMVVFITENGNPNERLFGMITPWDVLRSEEG